MVGERSMVSFEPENHSVDLTLPAAGYSRFIPNALSGLRQITRGFPDMLGGNNLSAHARSCTVCGVSGIKLKIMLSQTRLRSSINRKYPAAELILGTDVRLGQKLDIYVQECIRTSGPLRVAGAHNGQQHFIKI